MSSIAKAVLKWLIKATLRVKPGPKVPEVK